jgi:crotonobetainyl-CoA:carnitine CoA-transferase CaiB-like acyl-CoA transferase
MADRARVRPALDGVRVVDASNLLAAPFISMFLGDHGAEVVKVERPGRGDELRLWGHNRDGVGLYYKVVNRNKKSVTADLSTPLGAEILRRLSTDADILIENFRPGTLERWGLGYDVLSVLNPGLIMLRVTGYGQTGPYRDRPGFGTLAEAYAGFAHINGEADGPPLLAGFGLADSTTGLAGAFLAMVALSARERDGRGQVVDLAIYEPLLTLLGPHVIDYDQLGLVQKRMGSRLPFTAPRNTFQTHDGRWVSIAGSTQSIYERLCLAIGRPGLAADPRFADNRLRMENVDALEEALRDAVAGLDYPELIRRVNEEQAAAAPVYDVAEIVEDPHVQARGNVAAVEDNELGTVRMQNVLGNLSETPGAIRWAGPRLGEHNREILIDRLGLLEADLLAAGFPLGAVEPA